MVPFSLPDLIHGNSEPDYRLSDAIVWFKLTYKGDDLFINEPVGWDGVEWELERDTTWHGFTLEFIGEEAQLKFWQDEAIEFLEKIYHADGPNADCVFSWGLTDPSGNLPLQSLRLKFDTRNVVGGQFTITGQRISLYPDIKAKWDTTCSMSQLSALVSDANLDPLPVVPPLPAQLILHAQRIKQSTIAKQGDQQLDTDWRSFSNEGVAIIDGGSPLDGLTGKKVFRKFYLRLPTNEPSINELNITTPTLKVDNYPPWERAEPLFISPADGDYTFEITFDFQVDARLQRAGVSVRPPEIRNFILAYDLYAGPDRYSMAEPISTSVNNRQLGARRMTGKFKQTIFLPRGVEVYEVPSLDINPDRDNWRGTDVRLLSFSHSITITANTTAAQSTTPAYPIIDVLSHLVACLTGKDRSVESAYYSLMGQTQPVDGGGSHRLITNGFALRGFANKEFNLTLKSIMASLQAIDAVGMGFRPDASGEKMVVEPIAFFYRNNEILRIKSYTLIDESTSSEYLHPSVKIGYEKYPDEGQMVLDDFNTEHEYVLPMQGGGVYEQKSGLVASGYAIELTRRAQFANTPQDSTTYDDDGFIICASQTGPLTGQQTSVNLPVQFSTTNGKPQLAIAQDKVPAWLATGVTFQVSGVNAGVYKVKSQQTGYIFGTQTQGGRTTQLRVLATVFVLDKSVTAYTGTVALSIGKSGTWQAERNESFAVVEGVVDPSTVYNLRINPKFNLFRHARYIAGGLVYANGAEVIRNQFVKNNGLLKTRLRNDAAGDLDIDVRRTVVQKDKIYVADLRGRVDPLWKPETVTVDARFTIDQMLYLRSCLLGIHPDPTLHYGYITLANGEEEVSGYPLSVKFLPAEGKVVLVLLKTFQPPSMGGRDCSFYTAYTFADFESASSGTLDNWIERCFFGQFQ